MKMQRRYVVLAVLAATVGVVEWCMIHRGPKPAEASVSVTSAPLELGRSPAKQTTFETPKDEYQLMINMYKLEGAQLDRFMKAYEQREALWGKWMEGPGKKVDAVRQQVRQALAAKDTKKIAELRPSYEAMIALESEYRSQLRVPIMNELTLSQQRKWGAYVLSSTVTKRMGKMPMSDEQQRFLDEITMSAAMQHVTESTAATDPYLKKMKSDSVVTPVIEKVQERVLADRGMGRPWGTVSIVPAKNAVKTE